MVNCQWTLDPNSLPICLWVVTPLLGFPTFHLRSILTQIRETKSTSKVVLANISYQLIFEEEWLVELQESLFKLGRPLWGDF